MPGCNLLLDGLDESGSGGFGVKADDEANFTPPSLGPNVNRAHGAIVSSVCVKCNKSDNKTMRNAKGQYLQGSPGRPRGAGNKLAARVLKDLFAHWNESAAPGSNMTKGLAAMEMMYKEKPNEYVRAVLSVMPKEFAIENFTAGMSVDDIDELMAKIRDMLLAREPQTEQPSETAH
jgi:hypothetical protein